MIEFSDGLLTKYTTRSFSFRSGIVEQKEHVSERENDLPRENVTRRPEFAGSRYKGLITRALRLHAASDFRERSCFLFARLSPSGQHRTARSLLSRDKTKLFLLFIKYSLIFQTSAYLDYIHKRVLCQKFQKTYLHKLICNDPEINDSVLLQMTTLVYKTVN